MLRFQHTYWLNFLVLIPIFIGLFLVVIYWRKKQLSKLGETSLVQNQLLGYIPARKTLHFIIRVLALTLIIIGCANLQKAGETENIKRKGIDVMVALDVSKSMLATDVQPDRLTRAKQLVEKLIDKMGNNRMGLIVFAGRSYLQVPLTVDFSALKLLLQTVNTDMVPTQGTVIGDAIQLAEKSFSSKEKKFKSIIIISDGEDHDENALEAAKLAASEGTIIHTIGVGSKAGATLMDPKTKSPKLDSEGNPVISKLNEEELKLLADAGHGTYHLLGNSEQIATALNEQLDQMEQKNFGDMSFTNYTHYYPYFFFIAFLLLIIDFIIPGARKHNAKHLKINPKAVLTVLFILAINFIPLTSTAQSSQKLIAEGNKKYEEKKYKEAAMLYGNALKQDTLHTATGTYNLGNSLYQLKQADAARKAYENSSKRASTKEDYAKSQYNIGNTYMSEKKWAEAIEAYKNTLRKTPYDNDAKYNLAYAQKMLKKEGGGGNNNKDQKNKDQNKQDQNKQDQNKQDQNKQDQNKENQNKENQNKQDQNKDEQQKGQQAQEQQSKLSEKQAEQILNALRQEEKKLQEKKQKQEASPSRMEKDW